MDSIKEIIASNKHVSCSGGLRNIARESVNLYREYCGAQHEDIDLEMLGGILLHHMKQFINEHNDKLERGHKSEKWNMIQKLPGYAVSIALSEVFSVKNICLMNFVGEDAMAFIESKYCPLGVYISDKKNPQYGLYTIEDDYITRLALSIEPSLSAKGVNEVKMNLKAFAPMAATTREPYLIPVKNGIFDEMTRTLKDFSPEYVFLNKIPIDYVEDAPVVFIDDDRCEGGQWDVDSWMAGLNDNEEVVDILWDILGAAVRPNRQWDKAVFLYATSGCNGKGTFCSLVQSLVGQGSVCSMNLEQMNNPAYLEGVVGASLIYGDENDVGRYIDGSANFKSLVTGDTVAVNRKYEKVCRVGFAGLIIQNCNEKPRVRDRTDSLCRRIVLVPFDKNFKGEIENKDIKHDYLRRREVLEYVLCKTLNRPLADIGSCNATDALMDEFRLENSSVRQWADEFMDTLTWDMVPASFAYDLYVSWNARVNGGKSTSTLSRINFKRELGEMIESELADKWEFKRHAVRFDTAEAKAKTASPEPLIGEYDLHMWRKTNSPAGGRNSMYCPEFSKVYRDVLVRK